MKTHDVKMFFSQAVMQAAIKHYLETVLLRKAVVISKIETAGAKRELNQVDHFDVTFDFQDGEEE